MNLSRFGNISFALALGIGVLGTGCKDSQPAKAASGEAVAPSTPGTPLTPVAAVPEPAIQYKFYQPVSEAGLKADTVYGYMIVKTPSTFRDRLLQSEGVKVTGKISHAGFNYYHVYKDSDVLGALDGLKKISGVIYAEPELKLTADAAIEYSNPDPRAMAEEYSIFLTQCKDAWTTHGFGPNVPYVADIDTGVNFSHEDLTGNVAHAYSWYDVEDGGALVNPLGQYDVDPIDYIDSKTVLSTDGNGHGTHTGGTIAATGNNGLGVAGVCWNSKLISYKGLADSGSGGTWAVYGSIYHLLNWKLANNYTGTIPVNMSLGGSTASQFAIDMIEAALTKNIVVIASQGNAGQNLAQYPSGYAGVIAVGATNGSDKKMSFSSYGRNMSVCAPGYNVISTYIGGSDAYESESGTSMSAPFVTGLVTYMLTFAPDLTPGQIKTYLEKNADLIDGATGFTETTGWGRVNVLKTIAAVKADLAAHTVPATGYVDAPLEIKVVNTFQGATNPFPGIPVNLYRCDQAGVITNYAASSITVSASIAFDDGVAPFGLVQPGYYVARTNYFGQSATTPVFQITAGMTSIPTQTITHTLPLYWIQTMEDAGSAGSEDSIITVWNQAGQKIATVDNYQLDVAGIVMTPQTYKFSITPYNGKVGEYALYVSPSFYPATKAPGTFAAPDATALAGSQSHATATPQLIELNKLYNCLMPDAGDYYSIVIP